MIFGELTSKNGRESRDSKPALAGKKLNMSGRGIMFLIKSGIGFTKI
jgi:hypothetical protein